MAGPLFGRIKNGEHVTLDDGRVLNPADFIGPQQPGRKVSRISCYIWFVMLGDMFCVFKYEVTCKKFWSDL